MVKVLFIDKFYSMDKLDWRIKGLCSSSIGLVTFLVKVVLIGKVHSMLNLDWRVKGLCG